MIMQDFFLSLALTLLGIARKTQLLLNAWSGPLLSILRDLGGVLLRSRAIRLTLCFPQSATCFSTFFFFHTTLCQKKSRVTNRIKVV